MLTTRSVVPVQRRAGMDVDRGGSIISLFYILANIFTWQSDA